MTAFRTILTAAVITLALSSTGRAGTLTSAIMFQGGASPVLFCIATNVGTKPMATMTVSAINSFNVVQNSATCTNMPQSGYCQAFSSSQNAYCTFTFSGSKNKVRAAAYVTDGSANIQATAPVN